MTNINLSDIFTAIITFISGVFTWMQSVNITIFQFQFTLFEFFIGSFSVTLFAEFFVGQFIPDIDYSSAFESDSGDDWIDTDYDD